MDKQKIGTIIIWLGFSLIGMVVMIDGFGINQIFGKETNQGLGYVQISGILFGVVLVTIGWFMKRVKDE